MPNGFNGATDAHVKAWNIEKGFPEPHVPLHWEAFLISAAKSDLHYAGERGWRAAFMKAIADDWAQLRMNARAGEKGKSWMDELTGGGGDAIEGTSKRVD